MESLLMPLNGSLLKIGATGSGGPDAAIGGLKVKSDIFGSEAIGADGAACIGSGETGGVKIGSGTTGAGASVLTGSGGAVCCG